jgi:acyl-CoA thioesterase-1
MIKLAKQQDISIILIGVRLPPNLGAAYNQRFEEIFRSLSTQHDISYLPKFLEGVAASDAGLMQNDGIHPTARAQPILAEKVLSAMLIMLNQQ